MKITFLGAAGGEVTGSAYLVQTDSGKVLVDCGFFQGSPRRGGAQSPDAVVVTHAHLDHTGRLPLLTRAEHRGPIYSAPATFELANLIPKLGETIELSWS